MSGGVINRAEVEKVIERIRPALNANGADVRLIAVEGDVVKILLNPGIENRLSSVMMLRAGIERALREEVQGFGALVAEIQRIGTTPVEL